jgi:fibro-slime domain-containing protein
MRIRAFAHQVATPSAAVGALVIATSAAAQPAFVDLTGIVRDFKASHPDFDVAPAATGHYAGNVDLAADVGGRPVYTGGGYQVATEWTDGDGRNIAPHLFGVAVGACAGAPVGAHATANVYIANQSEVYGYAYGAIPPGGIPAVITTNTTGSEECRVISNSELWGDLLVGPGGDPADVVRLTPNGYVDGTLGTLAAPISVPPVSAPAGLGPSTGGRVYNSGVNQITTDLHVDDLTITGDARVVIPTGSHVTILADGNLLIDANGSPAAGLYIEDDASLNLYVDGDVDIYTRARAVNADPSLFRFYMLKGGGVDLDLRSNNGDVRAVVVAPGGDLEMTQGSQFWGTFVGREVDLENSCMLYLDMSISGGAAGDSAGLAGPAGGSIDSASTFAQWFADVLGENLSMPHTITMTRDGSGVYEYLDDAFYPANGLLFGNEGEPRNYSFTYAVNATFTYQGCAGQFVEFTGADDAWLFVNGALVMDLGGVRPMVPQHMDLDRLGLTDGTTYELGLFYAQRNPGQAAFRLRTNLILTSSNPPLDISSAYD